jgi:uncharacterized membrane protein HdeD (DUF308 family)
MKPGAKPNGRRSSLHIAVAVVDVDTLVTNWWIVALCGVAGVVAGLITLFDPGISLAALVLLFGVYALVDGVLAVVSSLRRRTASERWCWSCSRGRPAWPSA